MITSVFSTLPVIILLTPSTNTVLSSPNTLPAISVTNVTPSSNNPAMVAFKSAVCKNPISSVNSERNVGAP